MDLLNMTNRAQIHEFYKKVKQRNFFTFCATVLKFGDLLEGWILVKNAKCQQNISKIMPARKKPRDMGCEYHCNRLRIYLYLCLIIF